MLTFIAVLGIIAVALLTVITILLREIRFAIHLVTQQLEYLGAPLEFKDRILCAARRMRQ